MRHALSVSYTADYWKAKSVEATLEALGLEITSVTASRFRPPYSQVDAAVLCGMGPTITDPHLSEPNVEEGVRLLLRMRETLGDCPIVVISHHLGPQVIGRIRSIGKTDFLHYGMLGKEVLYSRLRKLTTTKCKTAA